MTATQARGADASTQPGPKPRLVAVRPMLFGMMALTFATIGVAGCNRSRSDAEPTTLSAAAPQSPAVAAATKYTCPMHPEVVSDKPGKCSKCGMNLVPAGEHQGHMEHNQ